jgi:hypothetical protein
MGSDLIRPYNPEEMAADTPSYERQAGWAALMWVLVNSICNTLFWFKSEF